MAAQAILMGVDITQLVTSWGRLELIKDILLAQATLLTGEMTIQVENIKGFANPSGPGSLVGGLDHYNGLLQIKKDARTVYEGFVKDIRPNPTTKTASIISENVLKKPAETVISGQATLANPSQAMLSFIRQATPEANINPQTFDQAGAAATAAGATIDYNFPEGSSATVMQAIELISAVSSISVFVRDNKIIARPFIPFQGNEAGLKFEINDNIAREWGPLSYDNSAFNNEVAVGYPTDQFVVLRDNESIKKNGGTARRIDFPADEEVVSSNLTSARFFGRLYLERASKRRRKMTLAGGKELEGSVIGDRFPLTVPDLGLTRFPVEAIEVSETIDGEEVEMGVAELFAA